MDAKAPRLVRKIKVGEQKVFAAVAMKKGKPDFLHVVHLGKKLPCRAGTFYLDYRENGKRVRRAIGTDPEGVTRALKSQAHVLELRRHGIDVDDAPEIRSHVKRDGDALSAIAKEFRKHTPAGLRTRTVGKYRQSLESFVTWAETAGVTHLEQVDGRIMARWVKHLKEKAKLDASTIRDKLRSVSTELRRRGATIKMNRQDIPRPIEREISIYSPETLEQIFAACLTHELEVYQFFLLTGMRDAEVSHFGWADIDARNCTVSVRGKPQLSFEPKNYQERTIRVPRWLIEMLMQRKARADTNHQLVFATRPRGRGKFLVGGHPDINLLEKLKKIAYRAGLNCGECEATLQGKTVSCEDHPLCQKFGLHKFRHTFATMLLRDKVDIISVQKILGHKDLESTRRYLRALEAEEMADVIEGSTLARMFAAPATAGSKPRAPRPRD